MDQYTGNLEDQTRWRGSAPADDQPGIHQRPKADPEADKDMKSQASPMQRRPYLDDKKETSLRKDETSLREAPLEIID